MDGNFTWYCHSGLSGIRAQIPDASRLKSGLAGMTMPEFYLKLSTALIYRSVILGSHSLPRSAGIYTVTGIIFCHGMVRDNLAKGLYVTVRLPIKQDEFRE